MIDDVIERVLAWASPSDGDNLLGFALDAEHAFENTGVFDSVGVECTNDPSRLLVVRLIATETTPTLQHIAIALREAWSGLYYLGFEASVMEQYRDAIVMRFVTANATGALCVTGEVIATSPVYERLVAVHEENFGFAARIMERER